MNRCLLALLGVILFFSSCQKEVSQEMALPGRGSLQSVAGDCLPKLVKGAFVAGTALTDSNYIEVTVDVVQPGSYTVFSDTLNGYSFRGTGTFNVAGPNVVRIKGSGLPVVSGTDNFTVFFDSSFCSVPVQVVAGGTSGGSAAYTLTTGTAGACGGANVAGTYTVGTAVTGANTVTLNVNVTNIGSWTVTTASVAGVSFSGSGNFTATGAQTIVLNANGTPTTGGAQTFPVTAGATNCSFVVNVGGGTTPTPVPSNTYFPLTANSYWTYKDEVDDTLKTTNVAAVTFGSNSYRRFITTYEMGGSDTAHYRKDASGNFYQYVNTADLAASGFPITFTNGFLDILFLKETLTTGATWNSDHAGSLSGVPVVLRFKFTVVNSNATLTVGTNNFTNVYQIRMTVELGVGGTFQDAGADPVTSYYARGIGQVKVTDGTFTQDIRYWQVF